MRTFYIVEDCPRCGADLALRRNRREGSYFIGCCAYPRCKFTEDVDERCQRLAARVAELEEAVERYAVARPRAPADVLEKELKSLIFAWHPDRCRELTPHQVVAELTRIRDAVRLAA